MRSAMVWWLCSVVALAACGSREPRHRERPAAKFGTLVGRVRLANGAALPAYASPDLVQAPLRAGAAAPVPSECRAAQDAALRPVARADGGGLSGIVVAASDFTHTPERDPQTHTLAIAHCRLQPPIVAAMAGDRLTLENRDDFAFEPLIGPAFAARALAPGRRVVLPLAPGVDSVRCSRRAPCGRSDLVVFQHPVFAVTDARGQFRIDRFPAAEMVRLSAWHPLFEPSETFVWIEPNGRGAVELVLSPKQRFVAPVSEAAAPRADALH